MSGFSSTDLQLGVPPATRPCADEEEAPISPESGDCSSTGREWQPPPTVSSRAIPSELPEMRPSGGGWSDIGQFSAGRRTLGDMAVKPGNARHLGSDAGARVGVSRPPTEATRDPSETVEQIARDASQDNGRNDDSEDPVERPNAKSKICQMGNGTIYMKENGNAGPPR